jgi:hypothetical protein
VSSAADTAAARRHEVETAQHRLDQVLEQRHAAKAAVEGAERELEVDRSPAAQELWQQVGSVWSALEDAEAIARAQLEAARRASSTADHQCDRNARLLASAARRARELVDALPPDLRPSLGPRPLDGLSDLTKALAECLRRQQEELPGVAAAMQRASEEVEHATADEDAIEDTQDGAPSFVVMAEALTELVTRGRSRWSILDGAFDGIDAATRNALLATVVDVSALQPLIVLTDDSDVLSWAIDLPHEVGMATTTVAMTAAGLVRPVEPAPEPEPLIDHPMPAETAFRGLAG